ncbi:MAG: DUF3150 domain-containing protein [Burkholderiales bacterium]|nr:DUF3150 domain-containing protein [Burkholderiales bacterium]
MQLDTLFDFTPDMFPGFSDKSFKDESLLYVAFNLRVWTGTVTMQTGSDEGSRSMVRSRIVPAESLKPFTDLRKTVQKFCEQCGEKYLNGYVFMQKDSRRLQNFFQNVSETFYKDRDEKFAKLFVTYKKGREEEGKVPEGCAPNVEMPPLEQVLRLIKFEYAVFPIGNSQNGGVASINSFLDSLTSKMNEEASELLVQLDEIALPTEGFLCRCQALTERLENWSRFRQAWFTPCTNLKNICTAIRYGSADGPRKKLTSALSAIAQLKPVGGFVTTSFPVAESKVSVSVQPLEKQLIGFDKSQYANANSSSPIIATNEIECGFQEEQVNSLSTEIDDEDGVEKWDCSIETMLSRGHSLFI